LHREKFHNFYASQNIIRVVKEVQTGGAGHTLVEMRNGHNFLFGKSERKIPSGRHRPRYNNIKMDLKEI
jgi:hypothetical protein